jgi:transposase
VKVMHERVAGIDVHKKMVKVAIRSPGARAWTRKSDVVTFGTFWDELRAMAGELRRRGVTHVAMEASGVYSDPVYYALLEEGCFEEVLVVNPAHVKAIKGHKTDARDCARIAELLECGLLQGSWMPPPEQREMRDLVRYRSRKVQARTSEVQRLGKTLETAGIKLGSVASEITGVGPLEMIEALINGERRGVVMAESARGAARTKEKMAGYARALEGRFTSHHGRMCRRIIDQVKAMNEAIADVEAEITEMAAGWEREIALLKTIPGFGDAVAWAWIAEIGPAPHQWFSDHDKLASWAGLAPGNHVSAGKRGYGRTGDAGTWIKPALVQAAWSAIRVKGRLQARYTRLVRRMGGEKSPAARKKAIVAIAHSLLKIAYAVLKSGQPYTEPGADFYAGRETPAQRQAYHQRQIQKLYPGCTVTITITPPHPTAAAPPGESPPGESPPGHVPASRPTARPASPRSRTARQ